MIGRVMVEFPIEEADALRTAAEESDLMNPALRLGLDRLQRAVAIERGPSGNAEKSPTVAERSEALIGQRVRILTSHGTEKHGKLLRISHYRTLVLEEGAVRQPVSLSLVTRIEADPEAVAA